jgi:hypothetical protein
LLDSEDGAFVLKATSLSSTISQSVSQPALQKRERGEKEMLSMDKTLGQENKEVGASLMAPLNVPG